MSREIAGAAIPHRSQFETWILRRIFRALLTAPNLKIVTDIDRTPLPDGETDVIALRLPSLLHTLQILLKPDIMLGQTYVNGHWSVQPEKLYEFLYAIRSQDQSKLQNWFVLSNQFHLLRDLLKQRVFPVRSTRAVVEHYNSDVRFISLILGPSLCYTCAFFEHDGDSLEDAQEKKLNLIAERISLRNGDTILDLGSGWGYAAFPLVEEYGCDVTGITISDAQIEFCNRRSAERAVTDRVRFVKSDYVDYMPSKRFDRVISIGMLEHVGKFQYKIFFDKVSTFLSEEGIGLIHSMVDEEEASTDAWIDQNIFPGGYIPMLSEVIAGIEASKCQLITVFTHDKSNYFQTLEHWKNNLFKSRSLCVNILKEKGLSLPEAESVARIWEYFLSSSQVAFSDKYGRLRVAHFVVRRKPT